MKILAVESTTSRASVALINDGKVLASDFSDNLRSHSEFLNPAIETILEKSKINLGSIDLYACTYGPGSFTGVRVALEIVKTYAYTHQKKVYALSSLALLNAQSTSNFRRLCLINAFKNMVYAALYDASNLVKGPEAVRWNELHSWLPNNSGSVTVLGDALKAFSMEDLGSLKQVLTPSPDVIFPSAEILGLLAEKNDLIGKTYDWKSISPLYIRASEAEENLRKKQ